MGTSLGPLHLLLLSKAFADNGVHRQLNKPRGYALAGAEPLAVVYDAVGVVGDVRREFVRGSGKFPAGELVDLWSTKESDGHLREKISLVHKLTHAVIEKG